LSATMERWPNGGQLMSSQQGRQNALVELKASLVQRGGSAARAHRASERRAALQSAADFDDRTISSQSSADFDDRTIYSQSSQPNFRKRTRPSSAQPTRTAIGTTSSRGDASSSALSRLQKRPMSALDKMSGDMEIKPITTDSRLSSATFRERLALAWRPSPPYRVQFYSKSGLKDFQRRAQLRKGDDDCDVLSSTGSQALENVKLPDQFSEFGSDFTYRPSVWEKKKFSYEPNLGNFSPASISLPTRFLPSAHCHATARLLLLHLAGQSIIGV
jgi:hypothetical protein